MRVLTLTIIWPEGRVCTIGETQGIPSAPPAPYCVWSCGESWVRIG